MLGSSFLPAFLSHQIHRNNEISLSSSSCEQAVSDSNFSAITKENNLATVSPIELGVWFGGPHGRK